jgi:hypothetical protein
MGLGVAGEAGRMTGWLATVALPPLLDVLLIIYLARPRTKEEFADDINLENPRGNAHHVP